MSEVIDIIHNITYNVQDQELDKAVKTVQSNVSNIENLTKRQINLANSYDKTLATDEKRRQRIIGLIGRNTAELNKNTKSLENTMISNKSLNKVMEREIGLIGTIENKLKILQQARKRATSEKEISNYNNLINQQKSKLNNLNNRPAPGNFGASIGKGVVGQVSSLIPAVGGALAIGSLASQIGDVTKKFEGYETVLRNTFQSSSKANQEFTKIKEFASKTPFSVDELTGSFIKLVNRGFNPTKEELTNIGDLAASQGKSFDQLTEAILDGQSGEFERLKEFGIKAKTSGDTVTLSFKGIEKQVKKTDEEALRKAIISFGQLQGVAGGMAAASQTLDGKISNLGDSFDALFVSIGENGSGVFGALIDEIKMAVDWFGELIATSPADSFREEQQEINSLVNGIILLNGQTEARSMLITELNGKYPELFKNINLEKLSQQQLADVLKAVNFQYEKRILLAEKTFKRDKLNQKRQEAVESLASISENETTQAIIRGLGINNAFSNEADLSKRIEILRRALKNSSQKEIDRINKILGRDLTAIGKSNIESFVEQIIVPSLERADESFKVLKKEEQILNGEISDFESKEKARFNALKKILIDRKLYNTELDKLNDGVDLIEAFSKDKDKNDEAQALEFNALYDKYGNPKQEKTNTTNSSKSKGKQKSASEIALDKLDEQQKIQEEKAKQGFQQKLKDLKEALQKELITRDDYNHLVENYTEDHKITMNGIEIKYDNLRLKYLKGAEKEATKTKIQEILNSTKDIELAIRERSKKILDNLINDAKKLDSEFSNLISSAQEKEIKSVNDKYKNLQEDLSRNREKLIDEQKMLQSDLFRATENGDTVSRETAKKSLEQLEKNLEKQNKLAKRYEVEKNSELLEINNKYFDKLEEERTKRANEAIDLYTTSEQARFDALFNKTVSDDDGGLINVIQAENDIKLAKLRELNAEIINEEELSNRKRIQLEEERARRTEEISKRSELAKLYTTKDGLENQIKEYRKSQEAIDKNTGAFTENYIKSVKEKMEALLLELGATQTQIENVIISLNNTTNKGLSDTTKSVFTLSDSILSAASTIASALEQMADKEIQIRERRVDKATEIASRGNAEALQIEEERLRKAQAQKERYARIQIAINTAQQLSAATLAIAEAAASGGGWASVALVAAVIAALASGYSAVSQMNSEPVGFKDGVVGLQGPGTTTSDSIPARLSKGESVITAKGTNSGDNAEILKMMNNGVGFKMPNLKDTSIFMTNNKQQTDTKKLEQKLDGVIDAVNNIEPSFMSFDENGIAIITGKIQTKQRKRDKL